HDHPPLPRRPGEGAARDPGGRRDGGPDPAGLSARKIWASAAPAGARGGLRGSLGPGALIPIIDMWPVSSAQVLTRFASRPPARPTPDDARCAARARGESSAVQVVRLRGSRVSLPRGLHRAHVGADGAPPHLEIFRRVVHRPPHVRRWALIEAEPLFRLLEVAADDVRELLELDAHVWIERVEVVHGDETARLVPLVLARAP